MYNVIHYGIREIYSFENIIIYNKTFLEKSFWNC